MSFCKAQKPDIKRYVNYQKYIPCKIITYVIKENYIEFIIPDKYKSENRYVSFILKDTISGKFINSHGKHNCMNNVVRIEFEDDFKQTENLVLTNFFTWDDDFWVFGCCQIVRFFYISDQKGKLVFEPTCKKKFFYTFNKKKFLLNGNSIEEIEIRKFIMNRLDCN